MVQANHTASLMDRYKPAVLVVPPAEPERKRKNTNRTYPLTCKNDRYRVVLLAGGPRDLAREIRSRLAQQRGMYVKYHWPADKPNQWDRDIPVDVDLVIFLKDFASHSQQSNLVPKCKASGIRWIRTQRKWAAMSGIMAQHGLLSSPPIPFDILANMKFEDDLPEAKAAEQVEEEAEATEPAAQALVSAPDQLAVTERPQTLPQILEEAARPALGLPIPRKKLPSPRLAALAAVVMAMCADEEVSLMCTGTEMTFSATTT